jgi:hypothetical protein
MVLEAGDELLADGAGGAEDADVDGAGHACSSFRGQKKTRRPAGEPDRRVLALGCVRVV